MNKGNERETSLFLISLYSSSDLSLLHKELLLLMRQGSRALDQRLAGGNALALPGLDLGLARRAVGPAAVLEAALLQVLVVAAPEVGLLLALVTTLGLAHVDALNVRA
jgi:hypothetical protein